MAASGERSVADLAEHYGYYGAADATANGLKNDVRYGCVKIRKIEVAVKNKVCGTSYQEANDGAGFQAIDYRGRTAAGFNRHRHQCGIKQGAKQ